MLGMERSTGPPVESFPAVSGVTRGVDTPCPSGCGTLVRTSRPGQTHGPDDPLPAALPDGTQSTPGRDRSPPRRECSSETRVEGERPGSTRGALPVLPRNTSRLFPENKVEGREARGRDVNGSHPRQSPSQTTLEDKRDSSSKGVPDERTLRLASPG